jgi:hypothetical protein
MNIKVTIVFALICCLASAQYDRCDPQWVNDLYDDPSECFGKQSKSSPAEITLLADYLTKENIACRGQTPCTPKLLKPLYEKIPITNLEDILGFTIESMIDPEDARTAILETGASAFLFTSAGEPTVFAHKIENGKFKIYNSRGAASELESASVLFAGVIRRVEKSQYLRNFLPS